MAGYDWGERLLFWIADLTGRSLDQLYSSRLLRFSMMVAAKLEGRLSKAPR